MRTYSLENIAEKTGLAELQAAIAIYQLLKGVYSSPKSSDQNKFLHNKISYALRTGKFEKFRLEYGARNLTFLLEIVSLTVHFWYFPNNGNFSETNGGDLVKPFIVRSIQMIESHILLAK